MSDKMISWDRPMLERLKKAYDVARVTAKDTFMFEGNEFVIGYAKYLIEYLETKLPPDHSRN